jgi:predicted nucleic acid-binding Zn ribbon protein
VSDRQLWLDQVCPHCRAAPGRRCQTSSYKGKPLSWLHAARGWRQRTCPTCKAPAGETCHTPSGRSAACTHTARLRYGRREPTVDAVWRELEQWGAAAAIVRFHGGAGKPGVIAAVTLEDARKRKLSRWSSGEGPLPDQLAAPIWGRYASFRGHPRIVGMVVWDLANREVFSSGTRGETPFTEVLITRPLTRAPLPWSSDTSRDTSPVDEEPIPPSPPVHVRACERCGAAIAPDARQQARYCSKLCRQAASRARLRQASGRAGLRTPERCAQCAGPMPERLRPEARYCSKRCRQAASRARRSDPPDPRLSDTSRDMS